MQGWHGLLILLSLMAFTPEVQAQRHDGFTADAHLGFPNVTIQNPNGTSAGYGGISVQGILSHRILGDTGFNTSVYGAIRYHDLENSYESSTLELANHLGPALGLSFRFFKTYVNVDYAYMKARHFLIGPLANRSEFDYQAVNTTLGFGIPFGDVRIGAAYTFGSGTIKASESGLSEGSKVSEQSVWLTFSLQMKTSFQKVTGELWR